MKKEIIKGALNAFSGGFLAAFFFLSVEHDLTWHNFFVAFIGACIVAIIFGVVRALVLKKIIKFRRLIAINFVKPREVDS